MGGGRRHGGREGINISICIDTLLFLFCFVFFSVGEMILYPTLPQMFSQLYSYSYTNMSRAELCANIMIILHHPGEICGLLYGWLANLSLSPAGRWGAAGRSAATVGTMEGSRENCF